MTCAIDNQSKRSLSMKLAAGFAFSAILVLGTFVGPASADEHRGDHRGGDHRGGDHRGDRGHFDHRGGGYYPPPPVIYGSPYYAPPPVIYGSGISLGINLR